MTEANKNDLESSAGHIEDPIAKIVADAGRRHAFYFQLPHEGTGVNFNLVALHRMNMYCLQKRLVDEAASIFKHGEMTEDHSKTVTSLMHDYCTAVRDREFMRECGIRGMSQSPFLLRSQQELSERLFDEVRSTRGVHPLPAITYEENKNFPCLPGPPWDCQNATKSRRDRYILSFVGGIILMVPMIIMVLVQKTSVSLITVAVCTLLFAVAVSYFSPTKLPIELLSATATYAAVLVVFVAGTTGSTPAPGLTTNAYGGV